MKFFFEQNQIRNAARLNASPYLLSDLYQPKDYQWPGDFEGRLLLALCCHDEMSEKASPTLLKMVDYLRRKAGEQGYLGQPFDPEKIDEQQLAGHSWYLRGLLAYQKLFHDEMSYTLLKKAIANLYLPALSHYSNYPQKRRAKPEGEAIGSLDNGEPGWRLSSDVGCAFIALDGLALAYQAYHDECLKPLLENAIAVFLALDPVALGMQTHAYLSALRGVLTFYETTKDPQYLSAVEQAFTLYQKEGMTATYENYNWFGGEHKKTWTEPCAVVDSFILASRLYRLTQQDEDKKLARRIFYNGLQFCLRSNGGAGPNGCVDEKNPCLSPSIYEAYWCCSMRYAEGLLYAKRYQNILGLNDDENSAHQEGNRFFAGDHLLVEDVNHLFPEQQTVTFADKTLIRIPTLFSISEKDDSKAVLKVIFR
jgi:hypothetical protein